MPIMIPTPVPMRLAMPVSILLILLLSVFAFTTTSAQTPKEYRITPSTTDAAINNWNNPHYAYVPTGTAKNVLLVHFVGTGGSPQVSRRWLQYAATMGFHSIGIMHSNDETIASLCGNSTDSACYEKVRREIIDGTDRTTLVAVNRTNSIENRLAKALQYLQRTAPASENWAQFLTADQTPKWSLVIVSGHSQGGGHAAMIAKWNTVQRVIQFASVADFSTRYLAPAFWLGQPKATPSASFFGFGHTQDESVPWGRLQQNWNALGLTPFGGVVNVDSVQSPFNSTRQLYTRITPAVAGEYHGSMIVDPWMPLGNIF
jgi:hypothetical protein